MSNELNLTINDLTEILKADKMKIGEGKAYLRKLAEKHGLTDKEILNAFRIARKMVDL